MTRLNAGRGISFNNRKVIEYANKYFPEYDKKFMLWSPIVKDPVRAKDNQRRDIAEIKKNISERHKVEIEVVCNQDYLNCLKELRVYAGKETKALKSPVLRLFQIEEKLAQHLKKLASVALPRK